MSDFLLGVPGKLKALVDYLNTNLSSVRAAKLDFLTGSVPTATALTSGLTTAVIEKYQEFSASGTFTPSAKLLSRGGIVRYEMCGGGGGGSTSDTFSVGDAEPGKYVSGYLTVAGPTAVTIGAAGVTNSSPGPSSTGTAGGGTLIGSKVAPGGAPAPIGGAISLEKTIEISLRQSSPKRKERFGGNFGDVTSPGFCRLMWEE